MLPQCRLHLSVGSADLVGSREDEMDPEWRKAAACVSWPPMSDGKEHATFADNAARTLDRWDREGSKDVQSPQLVFLLGVGSLV